MDLPERRDWLRAIVEEAGIQSVVGNTTDHGNPGFIIVGPEGRLISVYIGHTSDVIVGMKVPPS